VPGSRVISFGPGLRIKEARVVSDHVELVLEPRSVRSKCPLCSSHSRRIHSRYSRQLADLPVQGRPARVRLHVRRFICGRASCPRKVFCERLPDVAPAYARSTPRLVDAYRALGLALGGQAGSRLAAKLGMPIGGDTLLGVVRATPMPDVTAPRVLGIDDWAIRRGQNYGTIAVDLERRTPVDLMLGRETATVATWLKEHPGAEVVARDRWGAYADGVRQGAPDATQVADRFHLIKNSREVLEHVLNRHRGVLRDASRELDAAKRVDDEPRDQVQESRSEVDDRPKELYQRKRSERERSQVFNAERRVRYEAVQALKREGYAVADIKRLLGIHFQTAQKFYHADAYPAIVRPKRATMADRFDEYLRTRWNEGERNVQQLFREVVERGYKGSSLTLRRYLNTWRKRAPIGEGPSTPKSRPVPSPKTTSWLLVKPEEKLEADQREFVAAVLKGSEDVSVAQTLVKEFREILVGRKAAAIDGWMDRAFASGLPELRNFVVRLRKDGDAVRAAAQHTWSTGLVEGQINRLKLLKRQMYGRAKIDLLRIRLIHAA
jgi:transposase